MFAKKNVVAAAVLTLVAVAAQAQVVVYGNLDASIGRKQSLDKTVVNGNKYGKTSSTNVDSSDLSQSFIGFKGQEDLGNGLKAVFKLESELETDTGTATGGSTFWNRNATLGLAGGFGALDLGRFENLTKLEGAAFNPFGSSKTFSPTARQAIDANSWSNGISYVSPNLGGLTLSAQVSLKESAKATATTYSGGAYALAANYTAGPLALSVVFDEIKSTDATTTTSKDRGVLAGASYDFNVVKLFGQFAQGKTTDFGVAGSEKGTFFQLGASIPVAADGAVLVSFGQGRAKDSDRAGSEGSNKLRDFSLGYTHKLSKRTNVYAAWINERTTDGLNQAPDLKGTTNNFAVGVRHAF
jgi:predicted porin